MIDNPKQYHLIPRRFRKCQLSPDIPQFSVSFLEHKLMQLEKLNILFKKSPQPPLSSELTKQSSQSIYIIPTPPSDYMEIKKNLLHDLFYKFTAFGIRKESEIYVSQNNSCWVHLTTFLFPSVPIAVISPMKWLPLWKKHYRIR